MQMPSAQWLLELGLEDSPIEEHCNAYLSEPAEQLKSLMGNHSHNFVYESDASFTGYPSNIKLPAKVDCQLGVKSFEGYVRYERPAKKSKLNNSRDSFFNGQQRLASKASTPPSNLFRNSQQTLQPEQIDKYFTNFFKLNAGNETYEILAPTTPSIQTGGHDQSCISDISRSHMDAFNVCSDQFFRTDNGPPDMRISGATVGNRYSNNLSNRTWSHTQDHNVAERKRREKLSQRFIALSVIIPGLKKMDKASVLGDAIKYVKQLEDRIKAIEEQVPKRTVQSVVYVKREELCTNDQDDSEKVSSSSVNSSSDRAITEAVLAPEIETRVVNRNVLIHILCEKKKHLLMEFLAELEKLQLTVLNASILSVSDSTFDLTLNAKMEDSGCDLTGKVIGKALHDLFKKMT